jgi:hypothetical protein
VATATISVNIEVADGQTLEEIVNDLNLPEGATVNAYLQPDPVIGVITSGALQAPATPDPTAVVEPPHEVEPEPAQGS